MTTTELGIKVDQFKKNWLGKRTDFDGAPKGKIYQCVDIPKRFWNTYWGTPNVPMGKALNYIRLSLPSALSSFLNKVITKDVKKGDAVVLYTVGHNGDLNYGDGHIGIATGVQTATTVEIIEQNGSRASGQGTGGDAIRLRSVDKGRVAGVLRPKVSNPAPVPPAEKMPSVGSKVRFTIPRTVFEPGSTTPLPKQLPPDIRIVRGYDPKYKYRILVNSASIGNNKAVALYDFNGVRIEGWSIV